MTVKRQSHACVAHLRADDFYDLPRPLGAEFSPRVNIIIMYVRGHEPTQLKNGGDVLIIIVYILKTYLKDNL